MKYRASTPWLTSLTHRKIRGISLVEMMVTMTVGLFLSAGLYKVYQSNIVSFKLQKSMAEVQRNARFSLETITKTLHSTGYAVFFGSLSSNVHNLLKVKNDQRWDISHAIFGYDNVSTSDTIVGLTGFTEGSDIVLVKQTANTIPVKSNPDNKTLTTIENSGYLSQDLLLVTNANSATLFQASTVTQENNATKIVINQSGTPGNDGELNVDYSYHSDISNLQTIMYFIKTNASGVTSLYEAVLDNKLGTNIITPKEIASHILGFQIKYGIDSNNDGSTDSYTTASNITNWGQVTSVGIALIASSSKDVTGNSKTTFSYDANRHQFTINQSTSAAANRQFKRSFRTYIDLKNRLL